MVGSGAGGRTGLEYLTSVGAEEGFLLHFDTRSGTVPVEAVGVSRLKGKGNEIQAIPSVFGG